jgi:anti-sigma factor ChrR (cupin superfamily)
VTTFVGQANQRWQSAGIDGTEKAVLWRQGHGVATELFRLRRGVHYPEHTHAGWEQMFVLQGRLRMAGRDLGPGDFVFTEPGETHAPEILEDSLVLLSFGQR